MAKPWIKAGIYDEVTIDGSVWYWRYKPWQRVVYSIVKCIQDFLWKRGIAWHDFIFDECTPDFNCCVDIGLPASKKFPQK